MYHDKPYPQHCVNTTVRWYLPRIRPIFRVRLPDPFLKIFSLFSLKSPPNMVVAPSQQWRRTHDSAVLQIRPIFWVRSPDLFLTIFAIFSLKSQPNIHSGQGIHLMRVQRAFITCFYKNCLIKVIYPLTD